VFESVQGHHDIGRLVSAAHENAAVGNLGLGCGLARAGQRALPDVDTDDAGGTVARHLDRCRTVSTAEIDDNLAGDGGPEVRPKECLELAAIVVCGARAIPFTERTLTKSAKETVSNRSPEDASPDH
jgi:hypothetical protein